MKVLHCCLASFYIDNYSYQENILPKAHKAMGLDVEILASIENYDSKKILVHDEPKSYLNDDGIPVTRLDYKFKFIPYYNKIRFYEGLFDFLCRSKPNIIFLHDCQFLGILSLIRYLKLYPNTIVYSDCHTDFLNSGRGFVSKYILHKILYKFCALKIEPYVKKFFGVTPLRSLFLIDVYGIPKNKVDDLYLGFDDIEIDMKKFRSDRTDFRSELGFSESDILISFGGKIDYRKRFDLLHEAFIKLSKNNKNLKLLIFGAPTPEMKNFFSELVPHKNIFNLGWRNASEIQKIILASDLGVFPGTHSVLWEQYVALQIPCIFKKWEGMTHVDIGGNCVLLNKSSDILTKLSEVLMQPEILEKMKLSAASLDSGKFLYSNISKLSLEISS